jgi:hypothetical protein
MVGGHLIHKSHAEKLFQNRRQESHQEQDFLGYQHCRVIPWAYLLHAHCSLHKGRSEFRPLPEEQGPIIPDNGH